MPFPGLNAAVSQGAQFAQRPTGIAALLADPALQQALLGTGAALLQQSDRPGTLGGALGRALPVGVQAFQEGRRTQEFEELLTGMPESQARVFRLLGPDAGAGALAQSLLAGPPELTAVGANERFVDPVTGEVVLDAVPDVASAPASVDEFLFARENGFEGSYTDFLTAKRSPGVTVNVEGDKAASAAQGALGSDTVGRLAASRDAAVGATNTLGRVRALQGLLDAPEAASVTGPGSSIKTLAQRFNADPTAREIAAQFDALAGQNVLESLSAFTGAISDAEREFLERIQSGDRDMTVEELRAGLSVIERVQRGIAEGYLQRLDSFDGAAFGLGPGQLESAHAAEAGLVRQALGGGNDPLGIRR